MQLSEPRHHRSISWHHAAVNGVLFQICWFLALLQGWELALPVVLIMIGHYFYTSVDRVGDCMMLGTVTLMGVLLDSIVATAGVFQFELKNQALFFRVIPNWLFVVWLAFSLTLNRSLYWLVSKPAWFVIACSFAGPLSYIAGRNLGVVQFSNPTILILMLEWFLMSLIVLYVCRYSKSKVTLNLTR